MQLQWKPFRIDMVSLGMFVKSYLVNADGIVADENGFQVIEKFPFTQTEIDAFNAYYDTLTEAGEIVKMTPTMESIVKGKIAAAISFGQVMMLEIATENVLLGFTTNQVLEMLIKCAAIKGMFESGSLYTAIQALEDLEPDSLLSQARIDKYRHKIQTYLGVPLT